MPHITFLSPSNVSALTAECRALISNLNIEIIDEDLIQKVSGDDKIFIGRYDNWNSIPQGTPRIRKIDSNGVETVLFASEYVIDFAAGEVTILAGVGTDVVRADYFYSPLNDTLLERLLSIAIKEIEVLIHRPVDDNNVLRDYKAAICKRFYTNILKNLMIESRNFFAVSVGDRTISKEQIPAQLEVMKKSNEEDLLLEINQLRYWNKTDRFGA